MSDVQYPLPRFAQVLGYAGLVPFVGLAALSLIASPPEQAPAALALRAEAHGLGDFPRVAGQHAAYITKQLLAFQNTTRDVAVMHAVTTTLQRAEMTAVATYLQSLP